MDLEPLDLEPTAAPDLWRKAIPQLRDRRQSQTLVAIVASLLLALTLWSLALALPAAGSFPTFLLGAVVISLAFAVLVVRLKAGTPAGAACGGMICFLLIDWTGTYLPETRIESPARTALTPLVVLFLLTFLATRAGRRRKAQAGLAESRRGRTAAQVIANLGCAALCVNPWMATLVGRSLALGSSEVVTALALAWTLKIMCLAALVEATADTVSSEMGQAYGGAPRMLLTLQPIAPGTDGAVTLLGTAAGILGGAGVALAGMWAMHLHLREALISTAAGALGLFFDSVLGATVERRGWLGNDLVNFSSTVFASLAAAGLYRTVM